MTRIYRVQHFFIENLKKLQEDIEEIKNKIIIFNMDYSLSIAKYTYANFEKQTNDVVNSFQEFKNMQLIGWTKDEWQKTWQKNTKTSEINQENQ